MRIITTLKDAKGLKVGEEYIIDVFPDDIDKYLENEDKYHEKYDKIQEAVEAGLSSEKKEAPIHQASFIKRMKEADLVEYANELGLEATVKDKKKDTLKKVLSFLGIK